MARALSLSRHFKTRLASPFAALLQTQLQTWRPSRSFDQSIFCLVVERSYYEYSPEPFHPLRGRTPIWKSADEAVQIIESGMKVYVHSAAATPTPLVEAMARWGKTANLKNVEVIHIHTDGPLPHVGEEYEGLVNPQCPRTHGPGGIHQSHLDCLTVADFPLHEHKPGVISDADRQIGKLIAENLVDNGATLQMGIGTIPDASLAELANHKDLGIHSEMFSDGVVDLVETGAITNEKKKILPGRIVSSFVIGTKKAFDFIDNNPFVIMMDVGFVNRVSISSLNPKVTAINSCIEVDLTGQVVSDSIGTKMYSGVGGQIDFLRSAALGFDGLGKPILAINSVTSKGQSKIVPFIKE
ncbi:hypothetical protein QZH41_013458, partial [Actinostola sp. cb2023]